MYQERYWKELYQLKYHINYLDLYLIDSDRKDNAINIFLALTSSGSIAAWAIWKDMGFVWAFIIAASQVVTALKNFIPYKVRKKSLTGLIRDLEDIMLLAEKNWFKVSEGRLTEEQIHDLRFDIRSKKTDTLNKHLGSNVLPARKELLEKAQNSTDTYFDHFYPAEGSNG
jgi:hypothetical protein